MRAESPEPLEPWRRIWREGFQPGVSTAALRSLREGLARGDARIIQGSTTFPSPHLHHFDRLVRAACLLGYCGWQGEGWDSVGDVEQYFVRSCFEADVRLGGVGASAEFLNWFDDQPRAEVFRELIAEIDRELERRSAPALDLTVVSVLLEESACSTCTRSP